MALLRVAPGGGLLVMSSFMKLRGIVAAICSLLLKKQPKYIVMSNTNSWASYQPLQQEPSFISI
jgi:hypothetical protein